MYAFQEASATVLLPLLNEEMAHIQLPNIVFRRRELQPRVTCGNVVCSVPNDFLQTALTPDMCSTALFIKSWICSSCGKEFCSECMEALGAEVSCESISIFAVLLFFLTNSQTTRLLLAHPIQALIISKVQAFSQLVASKPTNLPKPSKTWS